MAYNCFSSLVGCEESGGALFFRRFRGSASHCICRKAAAVGLFPCKLNEAFGGDSLPPSAWRRVIRCGPGSGETAGRTISSGRGSIRSSTWTTRWPSLASAIDWRFLEDRFGAVYSDKAGHPPLPTRLMAGLSILKHMHGLSDEDLCARWVENPYYQLFCGEEFFQHKLTFDRSSLTRWRRKRDVTAAGHYAAIACEPAPVHFHGSSSSIFVFG